MGGGFPFGTVDHQVTLGNYSFWFETAANARAFTANVSRFAPRYGGYCGIAMTGRDDCCAPAKFCLGPTCTHREWYIILCSPHE